MVDVQRPTAQPPQQQRVSSTSTAAATSAGHAATATNARATPSPSTSSASSSVLGDDTYAAGAQYRSSLKDEDVTEGEESLYSGSISSPYFYGNQTGSTPTPQQQLARDDDEFFASYASTPQQELDDQMRSNTWDYYYPPPPSTPASMPPSSSFAPSAPTASGSAPKQLSRNPQQLPSRFPQDPQNPRNKPPQPNNLSGLRYTATTSAFPSSSLATTMSTATTSTSSNASNRPGVKRPLERVSASSPMASPTVSIASSMIAMRNIPDALDLAQTSKAMLTHPSVAKASSSAFASNTINISTNSINLSASSVTAAPTRTAPTASSVRKVKKASMDEEDLDTSLEPAAKKTKVSRERQLKINAASRRCRKKQKVRNNTSLTPSSETLSLTLFCWLLLPE